MNKKDALKAILNSETKYLINGVLNLYKPEIMQLINSDFKYAMIQKWLQDEISKVEGFEGYKFDNIKFKNAFSYFKNNKCDLTSKQPEPQIQRNTFSEVQKPVFENNVEKIDDLDTDIYSEEKSGNFFDE